MADDQANEIGLGGADMRDSRAVKMSQIYTPSEWRDNPVELRGMNAGWDALRGAIVEQAIVDYMKALRTIKQYPKEYREYALALYRFGNSTPTSIDEMFAEMDKMRQWGIVFQVAIRKKDRWYGFTGKNVTNEQLEAIFEWQGEFYTKITVQPNKISRGVERVRKAYAMKQDCERFFDGDMYKSLCRLDKDYLLRIMREKVEEEYEQGNVPQQSKKSRTRRSNHGKKRKR